MGWHDRLVLSLLARLSALILVYRNALLLRAALGSRPASRTGRRRVELLVADSRRVIDRDVAGALGAGLATTVTLFVGCLLWIASGWEGGASGVMLGGVYFALYFTNTNPGLLLKNTFTGVARRP